MRLAVFGDSVAVKAMALSLSVLMGLPCQALAAGATQVGEPPASASPKAALKPVDVALAGDGLLHGQVLNAAGKPLPNASVALFGRDGKPVVAKTNQHGAFAYKGVKGGVYGLQSGETLRVCRVWAPKTAPPKAAKAVMLVADAKTVRGQHGPPPHINEAVKRSKRLLANPLVVAGVVGTAIAVPVAIANDDDSSS